jgi:hypothetical protein
MNPNSQTKFDPAAASAHTRQRAADFAKLLHNLKTRLFPGIVILLSVFSAWCGRPVHASTTKTYLVTSAGGSSSVPGTLPWAVFQANYFGEDINTIKFNILGGTDEIVIVLADTLYIARPMIIDGTSQPDYAGQPRIHIDCNQKASGFNIVTVTDGSIPPFSDGSPATGGGSTIQGFRITDYSSNAITLSQTADGNTIADNQIGFAPLPAPGTFSKNSTLFPGCRGIGIASNSNTIRGNTISGVDNAITLGDDINNPVGFTCKNNTFENNFIGTDPTGMIKIGNTSDGIFLGAGAQQNSIGPGNVLSGMDSSGVELLHSTATGNIIFDNIIGLDAAGTGPIGNGELGVLLANGAADNMVGGPYGGIYPGNVICGNTFGGVAIGTPGYPVDATNDNHVEGNFIGTNAAQSKTLGAQTSGVTVQTQSQGNIIRRNVIVGQVNHGVVFATGANNNAMYGNWIGATSTGNVIENKGYGVYVKDSSNNTIQLPAADVGVGTERNIFGSNLLGPVGVSGNSSNNIYDLSTSASQLENISTRANVGTGESVLIGGIIITVNTKQVVLRAIGPSLSNFGVTDALADPTLELHNSSGAIIAKNNNWMDNTAEDQTILTDRMLAPGDPAESALVANLAPGSYTAIVTGVNNTSGTALVEAYDLDDGTTDSKLGNISTRGFVQADDAGAMIGGFILGSGDGIFSKVIVRGLGPSLSNFGVNDALSDPILELHDANGAIVASNDNWMDHPDMQTVMDHNLAPSDPKESAIYKVLPIGAYTAVLSGVGGTSGVALVESYDVSTGTVSTVH